MCGGDDDDEAEEADNDDGGGDGDDDDDDDDDEDSHNDDDDEEETDSTSVIQVRTKVLLAPRRVFEVGIHHISKQLQEHWVPRRYNASRALLHHYRECLHDYDMNCKNWVRDTIIRDR